MCLCLEKKSNHYVTTSTLTRKAGENQYVRKTSTCNTNKHSFVSQPESVTQSWNSPLVLENRRKHLLTGFEPRVTSNIKHGHSRHTSESRKTRCTLKQIWPLALISDRRSCYWQTQPKAPVVSSKLVGSNSSTRHSRITFPIMEMSLLVSEDVNMLVAATGNLFVHLLISLSVYSQASVCLKNPCNACLCCTNPASV